MPRTAPMTTYFAPAERARPEEVAELAESIAHLSPLLQVLLDAMPGTVMLLNQQRQILLANRPLLSLLSLGEEDLLGLRPGEALSCVHASEHPAAGCGTSEACSTCGAVRAILASQAGKARVEECRITRLGGEALDFQVKASPLEWEGHSFTVFALTDISHEKRRRALERVFFHDVLNTITALKASASMLQRGQTHAPVELVPLLKGVVDRLAEEIASQKQLMEAETDELTVDPAPVDPIELIDELDELYGRQADSLSRLLCVDTAPGLPMLVTDPALLRRVLGNMLRNALEASRAGDTVTLGCRAAGDRLDFWVHNPGAMPRDVQLQMFQRSFSTKGSGRGLGTYSMRLLTERYLKGSITFSSSTVDGTTFRVSLPLQLS